jgi:hypothetical protein
MFRLPTLRLKLAEDYWIGQTFYLTAASRFSLRIVMVGLGLALGIGNTLSFKRATCSSIPHFAL